MKEYITSAIVACQTMAMSLYAYDSSAPDPSIHDVWEAQKHAWQSEQAALHSSVNRDDIGWQKHTQDAWFHRRNANEMEIRMLQNERRCAYEQEQRRLRMMQQDNQEDSNWLFNDVSSSRYEECNKREYGIPNVEVRSSGVLENRLGTDSMSSNFDVSPEGLYARDFLSLRNRRNEAEISGTSVNQKRNLEYKKLAWHIHDNGWCYTSPCAGGGTDLYWSGGVDSYGRKMRHDLRLASSTVSGLKASDFKYKKGAPGLVAPGLKYDILRDKFEQLYQTVFGVASVTAPTPNEQKAEDYYKAKLIEASQEAEQ